MQPPLLEVSHITAQLPFYVLLGWECVVTSPLWTCGLEGKTFQEALILAKEVMKSMDFSLPLTPPSPPAPPVGITSAQAGGAHPRTPLCSGSGSPPLLSTPSSCWAMSRELWSSGKVFQSCSSCILNWKGDLKNNKKKRNLIFFHRHCQGIFRLNSFVESYLLLFLLLLKAICMNLGFHPILFNYYLRLWFPWITFPALGLSLLYDHRILCSLRRELPKR